MFATLDALYANTNRINPPFVGSIPVKYYKMIGGFGGDLQTAARSFVTSTAVDNIQPIDFESYYLDNPGSEFGYADLFADIDAQIIMTSYFENPLLSLSLSSSIEYYYADVELGRVNRKSDFIDAVVSLDDREGDNLDDFKRIIYDILDMQEDGTFWPDNFLRTYFLYNQMGVSLDFDGIHKHDINYYKTVADSFYNYITDGAFSLLEFDF